MLCTLAHLEKDKLDEVQALEKQLGKTLIAFTCDSNVDVAKLREEEISRIKEAEKKLNISLVAVK